MTINQTAAMLCPRWDHCSVNNCPLDPHGSHPLDKERKCTIAKSIRVRIASQFPGQIKRGGLTAQEWASQQSYNRLSVADKARLADQGRLMLEQRRLHSKPESQKPPA